MPRIVHEQFTSSSRIVEDMFKNLCASQRGRAFSLTYTVTSCSRIIYALHEQFAHDTGSLRRVHEQFMSSSLPLSDSCARVGAVHQALYVGTTSKFSLEHRHDVISSKLRRCSNVICPLGGGGGIYVSWTLLAISLHETLARLELIFFIFVSYGYRSMIQKPT